MLCTNIVKEGIKLVLKIYKFSSIILLFFFITFLWLWLPINKVFSAKNSTIQKIINKTSTQYKWVDVGNNIPNTELRNLTLIIDNNIPYIIFGDTKNYDEITVMKYNGIKWVKMGNTGLCAGLETTSMVIDSKGIPYILGDDNSKLIVKKYYNNKWVTIGEFAYKVNTGSTIAIDSIGTLYIALSDKEKGTVKKYNSNGWTTIGKYSVPSSEAFLVSLAIDIKNIPYMVFDCKTHGDKAVVMKYNGIKWVNVGSPNFSYCTSMKIDNSGIPYISYLNYNTKDWNNYGKITVMKYYRNKWVAVGTPYLSSGEANSTSIAIDKKRNLYIVYLDCGNDNHDSRVAVMKFDNNIWNVIGMPNISEDLAECPSIAIDNNGIPYFAYYDIGLNSIIIKKFILVK